jgi:hypothetical protein
MDFPQLSKKHLIANGALVAIGFAGIWFGAPRYVHSTDDLFRVIVFVLGLVCVSVGVIALVAKHRHLSYVRMTLIGAVVGVVLSPWIGTAIHPEIYGHYTDATEERQKADIATVCLFLGMAAVPLITATRAVLRKRPV